MEWLDTKHGSIGKRGDKVYSLIEVNVLKPVKEIYWMLNVISPDGIVNMSKRIDADSLDNAKLSVDRSRL
jgi:hypothetical protein